jgi:FixJ family two-component response regulator
VLRQFTIGNRRHRLVLQAQIRDDGPGIPRTSRTESSSRWSRVTKAVPGSACPSPRSLINQHGGLIECESRPGETTFNVYLPLETTMNNREPKVWVIDDDRSIRWVLERALRKAEMHVTCFSNGVGVMEALQREQPDVILTDIRMPGIDGLDLLRQVSARYPGLPVIIMTAHSDLDSAVSAFHGGAFEYLPSHSISTRRSARSIGRAGAVGTSARKKPRRRRLRTSSARRRRCRRSFARSAGWPAPTSRSSSTASRGPGRSWWHAPYIGTALAAIGRSSP